jgi:uncharacterized iron-regulated protein
MYRLGILTYLIVAKGVMASTILASGPSVVPFGEFVEVLAQKDVVYLSEVHTSQEIHHAQLETLRSLQPLRPLVVAMEMFQTPFQRFLDAYVQGALSETELLKVSEYEERWGYDPKLYLPILRFARDHDIKLWATQIPTELLQQVRSLGIENALSPYLPNPIIVPPKRYVDSLRETYGEHPMKGSFAQFLDVQLAWDNGTALALTRAIEAFPGALVVVLIGKGHVQEGLGVPQVLKAIAPWVSQVVSVPVYDSSELKSGEDFGILIQGGSIE